MIRKAFLTAVMSFATLLTFSGEAHADSVGFGASSNTDGVDFDFWIRTPRFIAGDAFLTLTLDGDFNVDSEYADIYIDGRFVGRVLDGNTRNDPFSFSNGDDADSSSSSGSPDTSTARISNGFLAPLLRDGRLLIEVNTSRNVGFSRTTVSGRFTYHPGGAPVPEPSTMALLGLAGAGVLWRRRRKNRA